MDHDTHVCTLSSYFGGERNFNIRPCISIPFGLFFYVLTLSVTHCNSLLKSNNWNWKNWKPDKGFKNSSSRGGACP